MKRPPPHEPLPLSHGLWKLWERTFHLFFCWAPPGSTCTPNTRFHGMASAQKMVIRRQIICCRFRDCIVLVQTCCQIEEPTHPATCFIKFSWENFLLAARYISMMFFSFFKTTPLLYCKRRSPSMLLPLSGKRYLFHLETTRKTKALIRENAHV